jgi:hypothetical protein
MATFLGWKVAKNGALVCGDDCFRRQSTPNAAFSYDASRNARRDAVPPVAPPVDVSRRVLRPNCAGCGRLEEVFQQLREGAWSPSTEKYLATLGWVSAGTSLFCSRDCAHRAGHPPPPAPPAVLQIADVSYQRSRTAAFAKRAEPPVNPILRASDAPPLPGERGPRGRTR